jgi:hypothetical protein
LEAHASGRPGGRGWTERQRKQSEPSDGRQRCGRTHVAVPPRGAERGCDAQANRKRPTHEILSAAAGIWPGRKTATTRTRLAWNTGLCSMSTLTASLDHNFPTGLEKYA